MKPLLVFVAVLGISGVTAQAQDHRTNHPHVVSIAGHPRLTSHSTIHILSDAQLTAAPISKPISSGALRLMLDEAIGMALRNNTGIRLAAASIQAKAFAADIARSDYFPKFSAAAGAIRFNEDLGKVVRLLGSGPAEVDIINQNSTYAGVFAGQPLTQLLTIKQAVQLADADRRIAQSSVAGRAS